MPPRPPQTSSAELVSWHLRRDTTSDPSAFHLPWPREEEEGAAGAGGAAGGGRVGMKRVEALVASSSTTVCNGAIHPEFLASAVRNNTEFLLQFYVDHGPRLRGGEQQQRVTLAAFALCRVVQQRDELYVDLVCSMPRTMNAHHYYDRHASGRELLELVERVAAQRGLSGVSLAALPLLLPYYLARGFRPRAPCSSSSTAAADDVGLRLMGEELVELAAAHRRRGRGAASAAATADASSSSSFPELNEEAYDSAPFVRYMVELQKRGLGKKYAPPCDLRRGRAIGAERMKQGRCADEGFVMRKCGGGGRKRRAVQAEVASTAGKKRLARRNKARRDEDEDP